MSERALDLQQKLHKALQHWKIPRKLQGIAIWIKVVRCQIYNRLKSIRCPLKCSCIKSNSKLQTIRKWKNKINPKEPQKLCIEERHKNLKDKKHLAMRWNNKTSESTWAGLQQAMATRKSAEMRSPLLKNKRRRAKLTSLFMTSSEWRWPVRKR